MTDIQTIPAKITVNHQSYFIFHRHFVHTEFIGEWSQSGRDSTLMFGIHFNHRTYPIQMTYNPGGQGVLEFNIRDLEKLVLVSGGFGLKGEDRVSFINGSLCKDHTSPYTLNDLINLIKAKSEL